MATNRREFLKAGLLAGIGFSASGFLGMRNLMGADLERLLDGPVTPDPHYGPLLDDPNGILRLPKGFSYKVIMRGGEDGQIMDDGFRAPGRPDGMGTFRLDADRLMLVRNHELSADEPQNGAFGENYELLSKVGENDLYDFGKGEMPSLGGTTTLVYNERTGRVEKSWLSIAGTNRNCAGGVMPWGSWLTCEENVDKADGKLITRDHGYIFEVPATADPKLHKPEPIPYMGRFNHEACVCDPSTGIVYMTEDRGDGLFYRYVPKVKGQLQQGGRLEALMIVDQPSRDTRNWPEDQAEPLAEGQPLQCQWLAITNIHAPEDDLRHRGFGAGCARFARGEGVWFTDMGVVFACTNGGKAKAGQLFRYVPSPHEGQNNERSQPGQLELFVESPGESIMKSCDNLTVMPSGDLFVCEDRRNPFLRTVTRKGDVYAFGENYGKYRFSEFAGAVFSPSGKTLFVNIQHAHLTLAITGPWKAA